MSFPIKYEEYISISFVNQWGFPLNVFETTIEYICDMLIDTTFTDAEIYAGLNQVCWECVERYNPKIHDGEFDYIVMTDVENRYFELLDGCKELLGLLLLAHPELRSLYLRNISDVEVVISTDMFALVNVTCSTIGRF